MKKVLVVEDDKEMMDIVVYILKTYGFSVHIHPTGLHVDELVMDYKPDLILLDLRLPGKSGQQVCKELKQRFAIPIILFSAEPNQKQLVKVCNANAFLGKPFDINEMIVSIGLHAN